MFSPLAKWSSLPLWYVLYFEYLNSRAGAAHLGILFSQDAVFPFPNSDEFISPLKCGGRGSVMFSAKNKFRKSHGRPGNIQYEGKMIGLKTKPVIRVGPWDEESSLGGSLKTFLFWESTGTYCKLCTGSLHDGLFPPTYVTGYKLVGFVL